MENFDKKKKKLVLIDLHGTLSILNIIHMYTLYFYGSPDYKKGRSENLHHKKIVLNKKIIQGMRNIFHICLKKIEFKV